MRFFNNLSIAVRVASLLGISAVVLAVGMFVAGMQLQSVLSSAEAIQTDHLPDTECLNGMRSSLADFRLEEYKHILSTKLEEMSAIEARLASARAQFIRYEETYKILPISMEEKRLYDQFKHQEEQYLQAHEEIMALSRANKNTEAFQTIKVISRQYYDSSRSILRQLLELSIQSAQQQQQRNIQHIRTVTVILGGAVLITLAALLSIFVLMRMTILQPLQTVRTAMNRAAKGDFQATVEYSRQDEIGSLAQSYNTMLADIASSQERVSQQKDEIERQQRIMGVQAQYLERANSSLRQNNVDLREFMQREFLRIEELTRHKDVLVELSKRDELHNGDMASAFAAITQCGALQLDVRRVSIWLLRKRGFLGERDSIALELRDLYDSFTNIHTTDGRLVMEDYPTYFHGLQTMDVIAAEDAAENTYTRDFIENYLRPNGISAMLDIPLRMGTTLVGVICAEHTGSQRMWTLEEQVFLRTLGTFVIVALESSEKSRQRVLLADLNRELLLVNTEMQEKNVALQRAQEISLEAIHFINEQNTLLEGKTAELANINGELQEKNAMLADANSVLADAYKHIQRQSERVERLTIEKSAQISSLTDQNSALQQTHAELQEAYTEIKRQNELLEQQARHAAAMSHLMNDQNTRLQDVNNELAKTYGEIRRQNDLLQEQARTIEEANTQLQEKNVELGKVDAEKNEMLGIVAHDLRNPLASIMLAASIIRRSIERTGECPPSELGRYMGRIEETADRMNTIISELLDLNALETGNMRVAQTDIDLKMLAKLVHDDYLKRAEDKAITLHLDLPSEPLNTLTDGRLLRQILDNIVSNAVKYSPQNKSVWFRVEEIMQHDARYAKISVRDEGPGLTASDQAHLFKKFSRLSAKPTAGEHSTGLGLSIVKRFAEALGGTVRCESSPETGSVGATFIVVLPIVTTLADDETLFAQNAA